MVTRWEREKLRNLIRSRDGKTVRRAQAILLAYKKKPVSEIASITGYSEEGIRELKRRWNERGEVALEDAPRSGRPSRVTPQYRKGPAEFGYVFTVWTTARLAEHMAQETGIRIGPDRMRQILHKLGLSWKRPAHTTRYGTILKKEPDNRARNLPDPEEHEKARKRIQRLKRGLFVWEPDTSCGSRTKQSPHSCLAS